MQSPIHLRKEHQISKIGSILNEQARTLIDLSLSDDILEHMRAGSTAQQMFQDISNVFRRHALLKKLPARRNSFTVEMTAGERIMS